MTYSEFLDVEIKEKELLRDKYIKAIDRQARGEPVNKEELLQAEVMALGRMIEALKTVKTRGVK